MNIFSLFANKIAKIINDIYQLDMKNINVEFPKNNQHGDLATNVAMFLAPKLKRSPRDVADILVKEIITLSEVKNANIAGPGFININLNVDYITSLIPRIIELRDEFGRSFIGDNKNINIEFVSVNPTGPMHVGHSRGAIYGDALANLLKFAGYNVCKEFYINDAGNQIDLLVESTFIRYQQLLNIDVQIPEGAYPGEYLIDIAKSLKLQYENSLMEIQQDRRKNLIRDFALKNIMNMIKNDLKKLGVEHDVFISERDDILNKNEEAFNQLKSKGLIYRSTLEAPKGKLVDGWEPREQDLFKSTLFGDDIDRPLKKSNGNFTYFATDIAYHLHKIQRNFSQLVLLLGADHIGYIKRIKAVVNALSDNKVNLNVKIYQLVNLLKNGQPFRMSKRKGDFITVDDVIDEVGKDILRFVMLSRKNDTVLDLDFIKIKEQSKENPVFYVQYAHTRACSVLKKGAEYLSLPMVDYNLIQDEAELCVLKQVLLFPKIIEASADSYEPHKITHYITELANHFHILWAKGAMDHDMRFINEDNVELTKARLHLIVVVKNTLSTALGILGITALEEM